METDKQFETPKPSLKRVRMVKSSKNYVNNEEFTNELTSWIKECRGMGCLMCCGIKPQIPNMGHRKKMPDKMGLALMKIVENYGHRRNYSGYTYLEDMRSEALLTCMKYIHNFDRNKSDNAFSYVTAIIDNAFKNFLKREKKQRNIKFGSIEESALGKNNWNNIILYYEDHE
jgi:hypothetical protein